MGLPWKEGEIRLVVDKLHKRNNLNFNGMKHIVTIQEMHNYNTSEPTINFCALTDKVVIYNRTSSCKAVQSGHTTQNGNGRANK